MSREILIEYRIIVREHINGKQYPQYQSIDVRIVSPEQADFDRKTKHYMDTANRLLLRKLQKIGYIMPYRCPVCGGFIDNCDIKHEKDLIEKSLSAYKDFPMFDIVRKKMRR